MRDELQMTKWAALCFSLCLIFLFFGGCKKKEEARVLAKVGKRTLTEAEFYNLIPGKYASKLTLSQKNELLKKWIDTELIYQEALKEGIHKESEVKARLDEIRREIIANEFLERYLSKIGSVNEYEVRKYFDTRREEYNTERQAAQIVVRDEAQAYEILGRVRGGELFSKLAREYSIDPSGKQGGVMGYIRRGDMPQLVEFEEALFSLDKVGDISEPIQTGYGYHIIKLLGVRKVPKEVNYEDVRESIRNFLDLRKRKEAFSNYLAELRKEKEIEANYNLLE